MALKLNPGREAYREFYGKNIEQMPKLIADGRVPVSFAGIMQKRLDVRNSEADIKSAWMDNYSDLGDAIAYHPDGRAKISFDSPVLRGINPESRLINGALVLTEDDYQAMHGEEFKYRKLGKTDESLSRAEVKAHPVWKVLARNQGLLNDYADLIFEEYRARFAKNTPVEDLRLMGIYLSSAQRKTPELRAWIVDSLENRSLAIGWFNLDYDLGRFLGLAPEALSASCTGVSNVQRYTLADVQDAIKQLDKVNEVVRAENLSAVHTLIGKL